MSASSVCSRRFTHRRSGNTGGAGTRWSVYHQKVAATSPPRLSPPASGRSGGVRSDGSDTCRLDDGGGGQERDGARRSSHSDTPDSASTVLHGVVENAERDSRIPSPCSSSTIRRPTHGNSVAPGPAAAP